MHFPWNSASDIRLPGVPEPPWQQNSSSAGHPAPELKISCDGTCA